MAEYIKRQQDEKIRNMRWGRFSTIGKNGCGVVAAYNTAVALGKDPDFLSLIDEMEKKHIPFLGGIWGTCIFDLKFYLAKKFGRADLYFFGTEDWDEKTRFCRAVVIFYKNKGWYVIMRKHFPKSSGMALHPISTADYKYCIIKNS